jgi:Phage tail tube protein, TTP
MSTVRKMSNVSVAMQSALGAVKTITGISKAAPGVVTGTHDFANGDYVLLNVSGMYQLNGRVFRVINVSGTVSFQLEDIQGGTGMSTVGFDTFASGTAQKITFGTTISTAASLDATGGDFSFLDTTTIHSNVKTQIPGVAEPISFKMEHLWDITDPGQIAMKNASDSQSQLAFKIVYGGIGSPIQVFTGYVGFTGSPAGGAQDILKSSATITAFGVPTYYNS